MGVLGYTIGMTNRSVPGATKVANGIRKVGSGLIGWAMPMPSSRSEDAHKDMPLFIAFSAIIFSLVILAGMLYSLFAWLMN